MAGHWEQRNVDWWETNVINCSLCGQMIPRDILVVDQGGEKWLFCGPECERLYHEYWLPKYGRAQKDASSS
jgi:ribosomal protein L24E